MAKVSFHMSDVQHKEWLVRPTILPLAGCLDTFPWCQVLEPMGGQGRQDLIEEQ